MDRTLSVTLAVVAMLAMAAAGCAGTVRDSGGGSPGAGATSPVAVPPAVSPSPVLTPAPAATSRPEPSTLSSPTAASSSSGNAFLDTSTWMTYASERYGFSIAHPTDWGEEPADHDWTLASDAVWPNTGTEHFTGGDGEGQGIGVSAWSVAVVPGTSVASWLQAYCPRCSGIDRAVPATMDGHAGSLMPLDGVPQAFFLVDGRIYAIACWRSDDDPSVQKYSGSMRLVESIVSTMRLLPGGPAPSLTMGPSPQAVRLTVAGTDANGPAIHLIADLPTG